MTAKDILDRVSEQLNDVDRVRWTEKMLLHYLTDAMRQTVLHRPDAAAVVKVVHLTPGQSRQEIPEGTVMLLKAVRNTNAGGTKFGRPLTLTTREAMDACWPIAADAYSNEIFQYAFVQQTPQYYWVYPMPGNNAHLELECSADIADVESLDEVLALANVWAEPLREYVLYRAFSVNAASQTDGARAQSHLQQFYLLLDNQKAARLLGNPYNKTDTLDVQVK